MDDPHEPIKLEQIQTCQAVRKLKCPSKEKRIHWIYATNQSAYHPSTARSGKWLVFVPFDIIDTKWAAVAEMTKTGMLGDASKVSTKLMRRQKKSLNHVICVYTYDHNDNNDKLRIKIELEKIFAVGLLIYKTNEQTLNS